MCLGTACPSSMRWRQGEMAALALHPLSGVGVIRPWSRRLEFCREEADNILTALLRSSSILAWPAPWGAGTVMSA